MEEIYLTQYNESQKLSVIIEGDQYSVWAYIVDNENEEMNILFHGFVCSKGLIVNTNEAVKLHLNQGAAPPLMREYANEYSIQNDISNDRLFIVWNHSIVKVFIDKIEFLILHIGKRKSYARGVSKTGPYGATLEEFYG